MKTRLVLVHQDMEHGPSEKDGAVLGRLYHGEGPPYVQERVYPVPKAQLRSLHNLGLPPQRHPEGTHQVPWVVQAITSLASGHPDKAGKTFSSPMEGDTKVKDSEIAEEHLDFGGHVEAHQHKCLCAPISCIGPVTHPEPQ